MVKQLKRKFITISMFATTLVLFVIIGSINISNYFHIEQITDSKLDILIENKGKFPDDRQENPAAPPPQPAHNNNNNNIQKIDQNKKGFSPETPFDTRFFTVSLDENNEPICCDTSHIAAISEDEAVSYATSLAAKSKKSGYKGQYKYSYTTIQSGTEVYSMFIFVDCQRELTSFKSFLFSSICISLLGLILVFIIIFLLSGKVVAPIVLAYEKQKRFITDASHELKTPLTIIDANTEVLEMETGENEWTASTKKQIRRLSDLTNKLVFLSKMDESGAKLAMERFCLSETLQDAVFPYAAIAKAKGFNFSYEIADSVTYSGDEKNIYNAINLLMDNCIKYTPSGGTISFSMSLFKKRPEIEICNSTDNISKGNHEELFERFYRADESRNSSTGGHGIGLSTVYAIVLAHKGKISAKSHDGKSLTIKIQL